MPSPIIYCKSKKKLVLIKLLSTVLTTQIFETLGDA